MVRKYWILILGILLIGATMTYILRLAPRTKAYMNVVHDEDQDKHDVKKFVYNYGYVPFNLGNFWAYYKLGESSGDRADSTDNGYDLSEQNPTKLSSDTGKIGICVKGFNTVGAVRGTLIYQNYVNPESHAKNYPWSIAFWYKKTTGSPGNYDSAVIISLPTSGIFSLPYYGGSDYFSVTHQGLSVYEAITFNDSTWYLIIITFDGSTLSGYLNLDLVGSDSGSISSAEIDWSMLRIFPNADSDFPAGWVDEFFVYKGEAFSQAQREYVYNNGTGRSLF